MLTVGIVLKSDFAVKNFDPAFSLLCTLFHLTDIKHSKLFIHLFMLQTAGSAGGDYAEALQLWKTGFCASDCYWHVADWLAAGELAYGSAASYHGSSPSSL